MDEVDLDLNIEPFQVLEMDAIFLGVIIRSVIGSEVSIIEASAYGLGAYWDEISGYWYDML